MRTRLLVLLAVTFASPAFAQAAGAGRPGPRALLPREREIALARSAAPASVSAAARIYVWSASGWVVADSGASPVACLVNRSWPAALEPECFDEEAAATIMPMEMRRTELLHRGMAAEQVEAEIARGLMEGRYRLPARLAVAYMMSAGQNLVGDDGEPAGAWRPHLMIYYPNLTNQQVGHHAEPGLSAGLVVDSGKPTANLMVVVPEFVAVAPEAGRP
jgi:hypothetical protein